jgi:sugar phosphate isomerase/epimerase
MSTTPRIKTPRMRLGCADFTWPLMPHDAVLAHIARLGFEGIDLGLFGNRSHLRPEVIEADVAGWADNMNAKLGALDLVVADVFLVPWTDLRRMAPNHPDPAEVAEGQALFERMLDFAAGIGSPGMTMNSGAVFDDDAPTASLRRSAETLRRRVDSAARRGLEVRFEAAVGSNTDTPAKALELLSLVPGLKSTIDYCHFVFQGIDQADGDALLPHTGHVQCRGAAPGRMQVPFEENEIDYGRMIDRLQALGYQGFFSIEYVWMTMWDCNRTENTMETIRFRDFASATLAGRPFVLENPAV